MIEAKAIALGIAVILLGACAANAPRQDTAGPFAFVTSTADSLPVRAIVPSPSPGSKWGKADPVPHFVPPSVLR